MNEKQEKEEISDYHDVRQMEREELEEWCNSREIVHDKSPLEKQIEWAIEKVYEYLQGHPKEDMVHIRRLHYWIGSRKPLYPCQIINKRWGKIAEFIDKDGNGWRTYHLEKKFNGQLGNALTEARYRRLIDWRLIIDNRNPKLKHDWYQIDQQIEHRYIIDNEFHINTKEAPSNRDLGLKTWSVPNNPLTDFYDRFHGHIDEGIEDFEYLDYIKNFSADIDFTGGKNNLNMYYIAFAIEKTTLEGQFSELCRKYAIDFFPGQGFASTTRIFELCEKAEKKQKPLLILYLADLDKKGEAMTDSMPINVNRAYSHPYNEVIRIGINEDQVIEYNLPRESVEGTEKTELDALDSNDMLQIVEDAFVKYTKYARKTREARNNRIGYGTRIMNKSMKKRMENIDSIVESSELKGYQKDMEDWVEGYNKSKQKEQKFRKRFGKYIWIPVEKKIQEIIEKFHEYLDSFDELNLENPNKDTLEDIQKDIEDKFSELFDEYVNKFHVEKVV